MLEFLYCNIATFSEKDLFKMLSVLPQMEQDGILRYIFPKDRLLKATGRMLLQHYFLKRNIRVGDKISYTEKGKPFIEGEIKFNISHSGSVVVVVFSPYEVGVDIELIRDSVPDVKDFLHPEEARHLALNHNKAEIFYRIWTKKEALLKAKGVGIAAESDKHNCLLNRVDETGARWYIEPMNIMKGYACAIAQNMPLGEKSIQQISKEALFRHTK